MNKSAYLPSKSSQSSYERQINKWIILLQDRPINLLPGSNCLGKVGEGEINFEYFKINSGNCLLITRSLCMGSFGLITIVLSNFWGREKGLTSLPSLCIPEGAVYNLFIKSLSQKSHNV